MHSWTWAVVGAVVLAALVTLALVGLGTFRRLPALQAAQIKLQGRQVDLTALTDRVEVEVLDPLELIQLRVQRTSEQIAMLKANLPAKPDEKA